MYAFILSCVRRTPPPASCGPSNRTGFVFVRFLLTYSLFFWFIDWLAIDRSIMDQKLVRCGIDRSQKVSKKNNSKSQPIRPTDIDRSILYRERKMYRRYYIVSWYCVPCRTLLTISWIMLMLFCWWWFPSSVKRKEGHLGADNLDAYTYFNIPILQCLYSKLGR